MKIPRQREYWKARRKANGETGLAVNGREKTLRVDLGLALLSAVAMPGVQYSLDEIAAWCGCTDAAIYSIEKNALRKLRERFRIQREPALVEMIEGMFEARRPARKGGVV